MRATRSNSVEPHGPGYRWGYAVVAAVTLVVGVSVTMGLSNQERATAEKAAQRAFTLSAGAVAEQTRLQLSRYEDLLGSYQTLYEARGRLSDPTFGHNLSERSVQRGYPGHQAVVVAMRAGGEPNYTLSHIHIEPHSATATDLGLTVRNDAVITAALRQATDVGRPVVTQPLRLSGDANGANAFAIWTPLYRPGPQPSTVAERRLRLRGWVGVVVRADQFLNTAGLRSTGLATEIFDGAAVATNRLAARPRTVTPTDGPTRLYAVAAPGRLWTLRMHPLATPHARHNLSNTIFVAGMLLSLLVPVFIVSLGLARNRAYRKVSDTTCDLRRSEQRFRSLSASSPLGVFGLSADGDCSYANQRLCELTGRTHLQLQGRGLSDSYHPDDRQALRRAVTHGSDRASALRLRLVLPDGSLRWVKTHAAPLRDESDALTGWVGSVEDVTTEVQAQIASQQLSVELAHRARHDDLTGLPNRSAFIEQMTDLLAAGDIDGVSVLFFDIDRFKVVNDSLGHRAGDGLLVSFAERLLASVRPEDIAARFGGDEFVIGLVGVNDHAVASAEAQRLLTALNETINIDGHEALVSVSMGVAVSEEGVDAETLLTRADMAMYQAKGLGKARFEIYGDALPAARDESTLEFERQLRTAIDSDQLRLVFQPIVSVQTRDIVGVESLVRWQHPERGLLPPCEFIQLAEDSGLIIGLGAWVLRSACAQLQRWQPLLDSSRPFSMTVNVSPRQLADPAFATVVAAALADHDVEPSAICLEITETALLQDLELAEDVLSRLRATGVRIAVDDFGTGYSSLSHLKLLPVDLLKIDRSFVRDLGSDSDTTAIVSAVVHLAGALGMVSVAEGVETREQLNWLQSMGCDMAQGYFLATPEPAAQIVALLRAGTVGEPTRDDPIVIDEVRPTAG